MNEELLNSIKTHVQKMGEILENGESNPVIAHNMQIYIRKILSANDKMENKLIDMAVQRELREISTMDANQRAKSILLNAKKVYQKISKKFGDPQNMGAITDYFPSIENARNLIKQFPIPIPIPSEWDKRLGEMYIIMTDENIYGATPTAEASIEILPFIKAKYPDIRDDLKIVYYRTGMPLDLTKTVYTVQIRDHDVLFPVPEDPIEMLEKVGERLTEEDRRKFEQMSFSDLKKIPEKEAKKEAIKKWRD